MARIEFTDGSKRDTKFSVGGVEFELVSGVLETNNQDVIAAAREQYNLEVSDESLAVHENAPEEDYDAPAEFNPYEEEDLN